ncbi:MAG: GNAT family N-acetyltransferase [Ferruginibacter sp.]
MIILKTERLILREFKPADAAFILLLLNNPSWLQFIGDRNVKTLDDANDYLLNGPIKSYRENGFGLSMVETRDNHEPVGMCGLIKREALENVDIGFALLPEYAGRGYAYEIAAATMAYAKDKLGLKEIVAITSEDNKHSISLLNKIGLGFEKMVRLSEDEKSLMLFTQNAFTGNI